MATNPYNNITIISILAFRTWRQEAGYVLWAQRLLGVPVVPDSEGGGPHFDQEAICSAILEKLKCKAISYPTCQNFHLSPPGWILRHHYSERFGVGGALVGVVACPMPRKVNKLRFERWATKYSFANYTYDTSTWCTTSTSTVWMTTTKTNRRVTSQPFRYFCAPASLGRPNEVATGCVCRDASKADAY